MATLYELLRSPQTRASRIHAELAYTLLKYQACYGSCVASAAYLAATVQANPKTYHRFLRRLRRLDLALARRLHRPDGRRWVNRTDVGRLWYHLVRLLGRLLLEWGATVLKCQPGPGHLCWKWRGSLGYNETRIWPLGPSPPRGDTSVKTA